MPHESTRFDDFPEDPQHVPNESNSIYGNVDIDVGNSALTDSRLDALRSMVLLVIREIDALKKILGPQYPRGEPGARIDLVKELSEIEKAIIKNALLKTGGNQAAAAKLLSVKTTTLHEKIKRYGIKTPIGS